MKIQGLSTADIVLVVSGFAFLIGIIVGAVLFGTVL